MDHTARRPPCLSSSRSANQTGDRPRTSMTPTWGGSTRSVHMVQPQNFVNASAGRAPIVNLTFNGENTSARHDSETIAEPIVACRADHEIYFHQLLTKKRGCPLWVPGPGMQLPVEYRRQGISIGDVGIIKFDHTVEFDFLFNIFQPHDHPINIGFVPQSFSPLPREQLERDTQKTRIYGLNSYLASSSVRKTGGNGIESPSQIFSTSGEAAILTMPDGASTQDLLNTLQIRQCISENAENWYRYVRDCRGRNVENGNIRVVVGVDKVKSWGIATSTCNTGQSASLTFNHDRGMDGADFYSWDCTSGSGRAGPEEIETIGLMEGNTAAQNQSVFVRTMNFTLSSEIWDDLPSEAAMQPVSVSGQDKRGSLSANRGRSRGRHTSRGTGAFSSRQTSSVQETSHPITSVIFGPMECGVDYHPSTALHAHLHEKFPDARVVITQDSDWISVLNDEDSDWISVLNDDDTLFPEPEEIVMRILKSSTQLEREGLLTICMKPDSSNGVNLKVPPQIATVTALHKDHLELTHNQSVDEQPQSLLDSCERLDPPRRPESTRLAILQNIHAWVNNIGRAASPFWLRGGVGVGKSTILQNLAEMSQKEENSKDKDTIQQASSLPISRPVSPPPPSFLPPNTSSTTQTQLPLPQTLLSSPYPQPGCGCTGTGEDDENDLNQDSKSISSLGQPISPPRGQPFLATSARQARAHGQEHTGNPPAVLGGLLGLGEGVTATTQGRCSDLGSVTGTETGTGNGEEAEQEEDEMGRRKDQLGSFAVPSPHAPMVSVGEHENDGGNDTGTGGGSWNEGGGSAHSSQSSSKIEKLHSPSVGDSVPPMVVAAGSTPQRSNSSMARLGQDVGIGIDAGGGSAGRASVVTDTFGSRSRLNAFCAKKWRRHGVARIEVSDIGTPSSPYYEAVCYINDDEYSREVQTSKVKAKEAAAAAALKLLWQEYQDPGTPSFGTVASMTSNPHCSASNFA